MSIERAVGGPWEQLGLWSNDNIQSGITYEFRIDGSKFRMARFDLSIVGQTLNINVNGNARMYGGIMLSKHDGTGGYHHPNNESNRRFPLMGRGTGGLSGYLIPKRQSGMGFGNGWLMCFQGYIAKDGAGGWVTAGGDYFRIDGRLFFSNQVTGEMGWNMQFGFSTNSGEAGAASLILEGLRL